MAEYIERSKVIELIKNFGKGAISDGQKALDPVDDIVLLSEAVNLIPAANVDRVVRCGECEFSKDSRLKINGTPRLVCELRKNGLHKHNDFCSRGIRMDGGSGE